MPDSGTETDRPAVTNIRSGVTKTPMHVRLLQV
jgi:hypothetical protein